MKYILLGWLLKGRCEVSALDGLVFVAELFALFSVVVLSLYVSGEIKRSLKCKK